MTAETEIPGIIEEMSQAEVERFVSFLPQKIRDDLAAGPWPEPLCGVCKTLDRPQLVGSGPAGALLDYHDTPFRRDWNTKHRREGREVYERCCEIYRAAGWTGEPAPWGGNA